LNIDWIILVKPILSGIRVIESVYPQWHIRQNSYIQFSMESLSWWANVKTDHIDIILQKQNYNSTGILHWK